MNAPSPAMSIVLACFNNTDHLESTLCSVLDQDYDNLQLIVVDGSTEDHTTAKLRHYRRSIHCWIRQRCTSIAQTINVGLTEAIGSIVSIIESGDLYLPGTFHRASQAVTPDTPWLVGKCQRIDEDDQRLGLSFASVPASLASYLKHDTGLLPLTSSFFHADLLKARQGLDESFHWCYDYDLAASLIEAGHRPVIISAVLAARRESHQLHNEQTTLDRGREALQVAMKHARKLSPAERREVLHCCDQHDRIYNLAEMEYKKTLASRVVVKELLQTQPRAVEPNIAGYLQHQRPRSSSKLRPAV